MALAPYGRDQRHECERDQVVIACMYYRVQQHIEKVHHVLLLGKGVWCGICTQ
jgi:hypothetical protein